MKDPTHNFRTEGRPSTADRLEMVKRFRRSDQTRRDFSQGEGVAKSTLDWWLRKSKRTWRNKARGGYRKKRLAFGEVRLISTGMEAAANWSIEIVSPQGWTIRSRQMLGVEDIARLLRGQRC